jgi:type I restriction-modification system DNA methylase subunit
MPLSWNEIKARATIFSKEWESTQREEADAKPFLDAFFNVFDVSRKKIGTFEHKVKKLNDADGYIDLLWKGVILVEMKSRGKDLNKAFVQAKEYAQTLPEYELPKYILVCDFNTFKLYDTEEQTTHEFLLNNFVKHVGLFGFISGYQKKIYKEQDPANMDAALRMGKLHDRLEEIGYNGHALEVYLVRILFCLFAEDTTIFNKQQFQDYIEQRTAKDGSDLAAKMQELFQVLNTQQNKRYKNLDEQLAEFPYVNGKLFEEPLPTASFDSGMRQALLHCCYMDWSKISPAIFGSMFQSIMNPKERRNLGAHYTSEKNILKLIRPLFLDELWAEFDKVKNSIPALTVLHDKIANLRFLDPACGSGNFLIITYREIRKLETKIILQLQELNLKIYGMEFLDISLFAKVNVDKFYGIEYEEFPSQIAQVAMWLIDHQMNMEFGVDTGKRLTRIPLVKSSTIIQGNALQIDWQSLLNTDNTITIEAKHADIVVRSVVNEPEIPYGNVKLKVETYRVLDEFEKEKPATHFDYILGNPPFIGSKLMTEQQRNDIKILYRDVDGSGILDYVTGWYKLAAEYIQEKQTQVAFVSTNSISQGEQVGVLWNNLINKHNIKIDFAHRTFKWSNEAKGNAAVYCVIVGFSKKEITTKRLFEYEDIRGEAHEVKVKNINPYLVDSSNAFIKRKSSPISYGAPTMEKGNLALDYGHLVFTKDEMEDFVKIEPDSKKYFKRFLGGNSIVNGDVRYCLWFKNVNPSELRSIKFVLERLELVKKDRLKATAKSTNNLASTPYLFSSLNNPERFLAIPETSSENRKFIPINYYDSDFIPNNTCYVISDATLFHFGILNSTMHMSWVKTTCGRMKSDFRYSNSVVYNNFPWPENPIDKQKEAVEKAAQAVLDARLQFPNSSLADLYDPKTMPPVLVKAHQQLDKAVDLCYRPQPFINETKRIEFLFELYDKYTAGLFVKEKKSRKKK